jgi:hypothetical protein
VARDNSFGHVCYRDPPVGVVHKGSLMRFTRVLAVFAVIAAIAVPVALAFGFDDSVNPPGGTVGTPYSFQFKARNGCTPYSFSMASGALPPGLSMDSGGTVSGTPTTAGAFDFWVDVRQEGCGCPPTQDSCHSQRPFTINIAARLTVTSASPLAPATVGVPYSVKLSADGGGSLTWSIASGVVPTGLTLATDGTLSGTPTQATPSPASFVVGVTDGTRSDTKTLVLDVVTPLAATAPTFADAEVGQALKPATVTATGGRSPYTWVLTGSTPPGVTFDPTTGSISGTPTAAGSFPIQLSVKDVYGTTATLNPVLIVKAKVSVKTLKLPPTKVGKTYRALLRTAGGVGPFTWKVTSGRFPIGIRLDRKTGVLSGKTGQAGTFPLKFTVTDALGATSEASLQLTVAPKKAKKK